MCGTHFICHSGILSTLGPSRLGPGRSTQNASPTFYVLDPTSWLVLDVFWEKTDSSLIFINVSHAGRCVRSWEPSGEQNKQNSHSHRAYIWGRQKNRQGVKQKRGEWHSGVSEGCRAGRRGAEAASHRTEGVGCPEGTWCRGRDR